MKTVIMAAGKGRRIASMFPDLPKPMIPIGGTPVLEHEIECLRDQGFTDIILTVGYMGQKIIDYFGDGSGISKATGKSFGVHIDCFLEDVPLGNAGALFKIKDKLTEDFLLLNADSLFNVDFNRFVAYHKAKGGLATVFTHPNAHPYDSSLLITGSDGVVERWLTKEGLRPQYYSNKSNAGLHVLSPKLLQRKAPADKVDLDRDILKPLSGSGRIFAYTSSEYVKDMGTPERYVQVCKDFMCGKVAARNLRNKQKAIFLDRDGTINRYVGFLRSIDRFALLPNVAEAIRLINTSDYLAIVVTNQPVIARGEMSLGELKEVHNKMETMLGQGNAYLDAIYYCPHHPDKGYTGEVAELKIECDCRKPKPGMLLRAAQDFNIDLSRSWMVGDSINDMQAGKAAGCRCIQIGPDAASLLDAVATILRKR